MPVGGVIRYPFSAVVGQDRLKLALILSAIAPSIGGVLVRGEKGTAKTTVVRGLGPLLPPASIGDQPRVVELLDLGWVPRQVVVNDQAGEL